MRSVSSLNLSIISPSNQSVSPAPCPQKSRYRLGESIASGLLSKWHKKDGDAVKAGEILITLETDKVAQEIAADVDGILRITAQEGDDVPVGAVVGSIEEGAAAAVPAPKAEAPTAAPAPAPAEAPAPAAAPEAAKPAAAPAPAAVEAPQLKLVPKPEAAPAPAPVVKREPEGRVTRKRMTPLRKRIAEQLVSAQKTAAILTTFNECDMSA